MNKIAATVAAVAAVYFAWKQVDVAKSEHQAALEQSLVSLIGDIPRQSQLLNHAKGLDRVDILEARNADAVEAEAAINQLGTLGAFAVPGIDLYEIGIAFTDAGDYKDALAAFRKATRGNDINYRARALRFETQIYYVMARDADKRRARLLANAAQSLTYRAYHAVDNQEDGTKTLLAQNEALAYLTDVQWGARFDCVRAHKLFVDATRIVVENPSIAGSVTSTRGYAQGSLHGACGKPTTKPHGPQRSAPA